VFSNATFQTAPFSEETTDLPPAEQAETDEDTERDRKDQTKLNMIIRGNDKAKSQAGQNKTKPEGRARQYKGRTKKNRKYKPDKTK
jgi:hypothetical protein